MGEIVSFQQLDAWREAHSLVLQVYQVTQAFPFYNQAEASLEELKYYFLLSRDLGYIPPSNDLIAQSERVGRLLSGLISSTERRR